MNKWQLEELLKDYHWKLLSIKLIHESMNEINLKMTAQYGLEAAMPKANGSPSDPIFKEVERREERWKKIHTYERDIQLIQSKLKRVENEQESEVLH